MKQHMVLFGLFVSLLLFSKTTPLSGQSQPNSVTAGWTSEYDRRSTTTNPAHVSTVYSSGPPYYTHPEFSNMMPITVTVAANGTGSGFIFISHNGMLGGYDPGLFILDNSGEPIYLQANTPGLRTNDFKIQIVDGLPYLVYHEGVPITGWTEGEYYVMDDTYTLVDTWQMQNGYSADTHELQLLNNENALMLAYAAVPMDLSPYGGPIDGTVIEIVIQELDSDKNVIFEWHSLDHIPITDTYRTLAASLVDYLHTNAIEVDIDGNLLLSNRHTSDIVKIDRLTGNVIWRLGGKANQFTFINDEGFSFQHDIRRLSNGNIVLFDNGNLKSTPYSRVVEYSIDETNKSITRVWQYPDTQDIFTFFNGGAQRLGNGNTMISWGSSSMISEVKTNGQLALEMQLGGISYRAFRFEWEAKPAKPPVVAAVLTDATSATVYASWNGATSISDYEIFAGATVDAMTKIATVPRTGFETAASLTGLDPTTCVFKILPVHSKGDTMPYSPIFYRTDQAHCLDLLPVRSFIPMLIKK